MSASTRSWAPIPSWRARCPPSAWPPVCPPRWSSTSVLPTFGPPTLMPEAFNAADLSVVVPTLDRWDILARTLAALAAQTTTGFETIVVVDDDAGDVPSLPDVRVLRQRHAGPGAARNRG